MSTGGLSKTRLGRMHDIMAGHVARGRVPGLVTLVSRPAGVYANFVCWLAALVIASSRRPGSQLSDVAFPRGSVQLVMFPSGSYTIERVWLSGSVTVRGRPIPSN